ncbi:proto-oncogene Mas-like [Pogona vitticeps]
MASSPFSNCGYVDSNVDTNGTGMILTSGFTLLISLFGIAGNGIVIWFLGFRIKRNRFTTYILNLCVADVGVAVSLIAINVYWFIGKFSSTNYEDPLKTVFRSGFLFTYSASQFFLTVISIDRCVSIFFPLSYHYHQPKHLPVILCVVIWTLPLPFLAAHLTLYLNNKNCIIWYLQFLLNLVFFIPGMTISTSAILIKVCLISPQYKRRKLLYAILLSLSFFLLFAFPMNVIQCLYLSNVYFGSLYYFEFGYICASLNSAINPFFYFLVGREKKGQQRRRMQKILEQMFRDEEDSKESEIPASIPKTIPP